MKMLRDGRGLDADLASAAAAKISRDGWGVDAELASAAITSLIMGKHTASSLPCSSATQGHEAQAARATERAREIREAITSFSQSPQRLAVDLDTNISALNPPVQVILNGNDPCEGQSWTGFLMDSVDIRLNALQKVLEEGLPSDANPVQKVVDGFEGLPSETNTRKRSATVVDIQPNSSPTPVSPARKRCKRSCSGKSLVWTHFSTGEKDKNPIATCNYCGKVYACDRSTHGTSTLWKHLRLLCPKDPLKGQTMQRKNQGTPKQSFSIEDCRQALADMVIIDEMPFTTVEGVGFRRYSKVLQPKFELPSRVTVARDCWQRYLEEKPKLKKVLRNQRICLTTDTWTSNQNLNYMCLTAHWIDDEWRLQKRILNYCSVSDHKGETLGKSVEECLLEWGVDRLFTITVDNASSNDRLIHYLKGVCKNWNGVVLENKFLHVRCSAHIVNLVVKSGLEEHNESIEKIRKAVRFVRSSPSRLVLFKKCVELEKISSKSHLTLDLETRWNATYLMLENAEKFEKAFARLEKEFKPFKAHFGDQGPPNEHDWKAARRMLCFLKLFEKVTTRLSASLHVTSSIVFHDIMLMRAKLDEIAVGEDPLLASMARHMKLKFQKYWEDEGNLNYLLFIAVILDPRYKLKYLRFCLDILYEPDVGKKLAEKIELALGELFGSYAEIVSASNNKGSNQTPIHINVDEEDQENPWDLLASQFEQHMEAVEIEPNDSELTRYLADKREMRTKDFDILNYWKVNSNKYPILSLLAKDVLAVPASTVPSESAFSTGGRIIDPLRCSLSTRTVEALICTQSWLHTSHSKASARELAEQVQTYEDIREEILSKDNTNRQNHIDFPDYEV